MGVPYVFGNATTSIPLTNLDANFNTGLTIGNTTVGLGNTVTTLGNVTLTNATIVANTSSIAANAVVYTTSTGNLTGNASVFSVNGSNVGIGTSSPTVPLQIGNFAGEGLRLTSTSTNGSKLQLFSNAQSTNQFQIGQGYASGTDNIAYIYNGANADMLFATNATERMRILSGGNVGIATTTPGGKLGVYFTTTTPTLGSSSGAALSLIGTSTGVLNFGNSGVSPYPAWIQATDTGTGNSYPISLNPLGGYVGVGTASPTYRFTVAEPTNDDCRMGVVATQANRASLIYLTGTIAGYNALISNTSGTEDWRISSGGGSATLTFCTGSSSSERARIDSSGNFLVGATSSVGGGKAEFTSTSNTLSALFCNLNASSALAYPAINVRKYDNNNTTSQVYVAFAYNAGTAGAGGIQGNGGSGVQFYNSSDARLKENVVELEPQLQNILSLKPSKFDFINGAKNCVGFIAQEVQEIYPDAISEDKDGYLLLGGISTMEARLVKAIQEQQAIIEQLKAKVGL